MPQRVKRETKRATRPDKPASNGKCVSTRQAMDSYGSGARTGSTHKA